MRPVLDIRLHNALDTLALETPGLFSKPVLGIDTETTGLDPYIDNLVSVQIANGEDNVVHVLDVRKSDFQQFFNWLSAYEGQVIFHGAKFDLKFLKTTYGVLYLNTYDTLLAERLYNMGIQKSGFGLDVLASKYLKVELEKETRKEFTLPLFQNLDLTPNQLMYGALDAWVLPRIAEHQRKLLKELELERIADLEFKILPAVVKAELKGFKLDVEAWTRIYEEEKRLAAEAEKQLRSITGATFNPNSPEQVKSAMRSLDIPIPVIRGKETTKEEFIAAIDHEFIRSLLAYRKAAKRVSTYGEDFLNNVHPKTGRIHASFDQLGTDTGRFSSNSPNLQNIPKRKGGKKFRECFVAQQGWSIISSDYNQQELRVMTQASQDPGLLKAYLEGKDIHQATAADLNNVPYEEVTWDQRRIAKDFNFGSAYGSTAWNLANKLHMPVEVVEEGLKKYWATRPVLLKWTRRTGLLAYNKGYSTTFWGRRRWYDKGRLRQDEIMRQGTNHTIQGTSGDMLKLGIYYIDSWFRGHRALATMVNFVHDEIEIEAQNYEVEELATVCKEEMEKAGKEFVTVIPQPADVEVGSCWK